MLVFEFSSNLKETNNLIFYKSLEDTKWSEIFIDLVTLNLLLENFGIMSREFENHHYNCCYNMVNLTFNGAKIIMKINGEKNMINPYKYHYICDKLINTN
jgi:hypothetical protein